MSEEKKIYEEIRFGLKCPWCGGDVSQTTNKNRPLRIVARCPANGCKKQMKLVHGRYKKCVKGKVVEESLIDLRKVDSINNGLKLDDEYPIYPPTLPLPEEFKEFMNQKESETHLQTMSGDGNGNTDVAQPTGIRDPWNPDWIRKMRQQKEGK